MMPGVPGNIELPGPKAVSPAELLMDFINDNVPSSVVPGGAVVGGADDEQQQEGVIAIMDAGDQEPHLYAPIVERRLQVRCVGPTLESADRMGNYTFNLLHGQRWLELEDSDAYVWMCHSIWVPVGPSHHIDSPETHESLLFAVLTVGTEPIGVP